MLCNFCAFHCHFLWLTQKKFSKAACTTFKVYVNNEKKLVAKLSRSSSEVRQEESSSNIEELLNPTKVASLERQYKQLLQLYDQTGDEEKRKALQVNLQKLERNLELEKRSVMTNGLRNVFKFQAFLSLVVGGLLASNKFPFVEDVPLVLRALGFWTIWLFTIPSLRARKPVAAEKNALNVAFLACPIANILIPFVNKDTFFLWLVNIFLVLGLYGYYFFVNDKTVRTQSQMKVRGILRYLDWGSWR